MKFTYAQSILATFFLLTPSLCSLVFAFSVHSLNSKSQRQHFYTTLYEQIDSSSVTASSTESNSKDEAPCYDSVCFSDPSPSSTSTTANQEQTSSSSTHGQATQRLGISTGPTVWTEFGRLAAENPSIANLGQGFPNWLPPQFAIDSLVQSAMDVVHNSPHQYTRTAGHPKLVKELAGRYSKHLKRDVDPMGEVAITVGASQALYLALQTLIQPGELLSLITILLIIFRETYITHQCSFLYIIIIYFIGDEVILFEPFFDLYVNQVKLAGGKPIYVPLTFQPYTNDNQSNNSNNSDDLVSPGDWILESHNLEKAITNKTKAIILNSPHNPTGKIFTRSEMTSIANAVEEKAGSHCVVLSDEVYKYIVHSPPREEIEEEEAALFEEQTQHSNDNGQMNANHNDKTGEKYQPVICQGHVHFASLPGMWERTITISSAGKTFSATGWQVGWAVGPKELIAPMHQLLPYVQFCASTVIQEALARALPLADLPYEGYASYYEYLKAMYTRKRDLLGSALKDAGFAVPDYDKTPGGGFFIFARIGKQIADAIPKERLMAYNAAAPGNVARQDFALCQWMAEEKGILCIPASPFFSEETVTGQNPLSDQFVRIAFCKTNETIHSAAERLMDLRTEQVVGHSISQDRVL